MLRFWTAELYVRTTRRGWAIVELAAEAGEKPENERKHGAEDEAGDDREVESCVLAAMDDVAGKSSKAEREFAREIEQRAGEAQERAGNEENTAEVAERIHRKSVEEKREVKKVEESEEGRKTRVGAEKAAPDREPTRTSNHAGAG